MYTMCITKILAQVTHKNSHPGTLQRDNGKFAGVIANHTFLFRVYFRTNS